MNRTWLMAVVACCLVGCVRSGMLSGPSVDPVPADFTVSWGHGATHAEWGRAEGSLDVRGVLTWVESRGYGDKAIRKEATGQLTQAQVNDLWRTIRENRFYKLKESYENTRVRDGFSEYIAVTANGAIHSVSVMNTSQPRFSNVMHKLNELRQAAVPTATQ